MERNYELNFVCSGWSQKGRRLGGGCWLSIVRDDVKVGDVRTICCHSDWAFTPPPAGTHCRDYSWWVPECKADAVCGNAFRMNPIIWNFNTGLMSVISRGVAPTRAVRSNETHTTRGKKPVWLSDDTFTLLNADWMIRTYTQGLSLPPQRSETDQPRVSHRPL